MFDVEHLRHDSLSERRSTLISISTSFGIFYFALKNVYLIFLLGSFVFSRDSISYIHSVQDVIKNKSSLSLNSDMLIGRSERMEQYHNLKQINIYKKNISESIAEFIDLIKGETRDVLPNRPYVHLPFFSNSHGMSFTSGSLFNSIYGIVNFEFLTHVSFSYKQ